MRFLKWVAYFFAMCFMAAGIIFSGAADKGTALAQVLLYMVVLFVVAGVIIKKMTYDKMQEAPRNRHETWKT